MGRPSSKPWRRSLPKGNAVNQGGPSDQPPRSELWLPFGPGAAVRVRYKPLGEDCREGGGALNIWSGENIVLHVNPRPNPDHNALVLNSHMGGWGAEERPEDYPIDADEVILSVWAGPEGFQIQATVPGNGPPFCYLYAYRHPEQYPLDRITIDLPDVTAIEVRTEL